MKNLMEDENLSKYLANSLATVIQGNNDYLNNYLMPEFYEYPDSILYMAILVSCNIFNELIAYPNSYGFNASDTSCCCIERNKTHINCLPLVNPCPNRYQYVFWDPFHQTQAVGKIMASKAFN
ncbi:hypothetical protein P8452_28429 [Trifolium repens]|nr:hypothetical protein P8452_28429 [Trifolium repens]